MFTIFDHVGYWLDSLESLALNYSIEKCDTDRYTRRNRYLNHDKLENYRSKAIIINLMILGVYLKKKKKVIDLDLDLKNKRIQN